MRAKYLFRYAAFLFVTMLISQLYSQNDYFDWPVIPEQYNPYIRHGNNQTGRPLGVSNHSGEDVTLHSGTVIRTVGIGNLVRYQSDGCWTRRHGAEPCTFTNGDVSCGYGILYAVVQYTFNRPLRVPVGLNTETISEAFSMVFGHMAGNPDDPDTITTGLSVGDQLTRSQIIGYVGSDDPNDHCGPNDYNGDGGEHLHLGCVPNGDATIIGGYAGESGYCPAHLVIAASRVGVFQNEDGTVEWNTDGTSQAFVDKWWEQDAQGNYKYMELTNYHNKLGRPNNNHPLAQEGVGTDFVHFWNGVWIQDFYQPYNEDGGGNNLSKFGDDGQTALILNNMSPPIAYLLKGGFWGLYKCIDGPIVLGAPLSDEYEAVLNGKNVTKQDFQLGYMTYKELNSNEIELRVVYNDGSPDDVYVQDIFQGVFATCEDFTAAIGLEKVYTPENFQGQAATPTEIYLSWEDPSNPPGTLYKIYKDGNYFDTVGTPDYTDTQVSGGSIYSYRVSALGNYESLKSDEIWVQTSSSGSGGGNSQLWVEAEDWYDFGLSKKQATFTIKNTGANSLPMEFNVSSDRAALSFAPRNGVLNTPAFQAITITADPSNLPSGVYRGSIFITSDATVGPQNYSIPVALEVYGLGDGTYSDDFDRTELEDNWSDFSKGTEYSVSVENNQLKFYSNDESNARVFLTAEGTFFQDDTLYFDLDNGPESSSGSLIVYQRYSASDSYYQLTISDLITNPKLALYRATPDAGVRLAEWLGNLDPGRYAFAVEGRELHFWNVSGGSAIDFSHTDNMDLPGGRIGFNAKAETVYIDNLSVTGMQYHPSPIFIDSFNSTNRHSMGSDWNVSYPSMAAIDQDRLTLEVYGQGQQTAFMVPVGNIQNVALETYIDVGSVYAGVAETFLFLRNNGNSGYQVRVRDNDQVQYVVLEGPSGTLDGPINGKFKPGMYKFSVKGNLLTFSEITASGETILLQAADNDVTGIGQVGIGIDHEKTIFDEIKVYELSASENPILTVTSLNLDLGSASSGTLSGDFTIKNSGGGTLTGDITALGNIAVVPTGSFYLNSGEETLYTAHIDAGTVNAGGYQDHVDVSSNAANATVTVGYTVEEPGLVNLLANEGFENQYINPSWYFLT